MGKYHSKLLMLFNLAFLMKCKYIILNDKEIMYHIIYNRFTLIQFMFADQHFKSFVNHSLVHLRKLSQASDLLTFVMIQDF